MEIINKTHNEYEMESSTKGYRSLIRFSKDMTHFNINKRGVMEFVLKEKQYAHFAIDVDRVYIFFNDDKTGVLSRLEYGGFAFGCTAVIRLLSSKVKQITPACKFPLRKSFTSIRESVTLEIMIHNKIKNKKA